jgi:hypothetical protein
MQNLELFFAENVELEENVQYVVSNRFKDKDGNPIPWEIRALSADENNALKKQCVVRKQVPGKRGQYTNEFDNLKYISLLCVNSIVSPDLNNAKLQDSWSKKVGYQIMNGGDLLNVMLLSGEYDLLSQKVQEVNGYDDDINEDIEEAKN